jgi:hypothetical protein
MAFYYNVKIVRAKQHVTKHFGSEANSGDVDRYIRAALAMPATVRVEVSETDTQLHGLPFAKRTYPRAVILKNRRAYKFYGHGADYAFLHDGPFHQFHVA